MDVESRVDYDGIRLSINVPENSLLVTPLNYDIGATAYIDEEKVDIWRVNSALCGVLVEKGVHFISFSIERDSYIPIVWGQLLIYELLLLFFAYKYTKKTKKHNSKAYAGQSDTPAQ